MIDSPTHVGGIIQLMWNKISVHVPVELVIHVRPSDLLKRLPVEDQDEASLARVHADRRHHHPCVRKSRLFH